MDKIKEKIIKELRKQLKAGKKPTEIARNLKISVTSVYYHSDENNRKKRIKQSVEYFKNLPKEKKHSFSAINIIFFGYSAFI